MEKKILEFVQGLRRGGVKVSPGEVIDALEAVRFMGLEDPHRFYLVLKATLIKNMMDERVFDLAFRLFFRDRVVKLAGLREQSCNKGFGTGVDGSGTGKAGMGAASQALYETIKRGPTSILMDLLEDQLQELTIKDESLDQLLHEIKVKMEWFMVENAFARDEKSSRREIQILKDVEVYLRHRLEKKILQEKEEVGLMELLLTENLEEKDFALLNGYQVKEMERRVERLANKLASRYAYRLQRAKAGLVDMRRVLQGAARRGRSPEQLFYQDKVKNRPKLVVLCDISGSVALYSAFLLQLVYAMHRCFRDLRAFLFVDRIAEITQYLGVGNVQEAMEAALLEACIFRLGISNFGQVFEIFNQDLGYILSDRTTVIILGDAKNNWYPSRQEEVKAISRKVKKIIWLNPEPREKWDQEDSIIGIYGRYCSQVLECRNLRQLEEAMRKID